MFENVVTGEDQQCRDFMELYKEFHRSVLAYSKAKEAGKLQSYDLARLHRLEVKVDALWGRLADLQRSSLVQVLLQRGLLPEQLGEAIKVFNGKVVRIR